MINERFEEVRLNDSTVQALTSVESGAEEIIIALANEKKALMKRVIELASIAPRKICHGGKTYIWHCPDELIPPENA